MTGSGREDPTAPAPGRPTRCPQSHLLPQTFAGVLDHVGRAITFLVKLSALHRGQHPVCASPSVPGVSGVRALPWAGTGKLGLPSPEARAADISHERPSTPPRQGSPPHGVVGFLTAGLS